jgi:hypothetical protein
VFFSIAIFVSLLDEVATVALDLLIGIVMSEVKGTDLDVTSVVFIVSLMGLSSKFRGAGEVRGACRGKLHGSACGQIQRTVGGQRITSRALSHEQGAGGDRRGTQS